ncbi:MAG TPA: PQQ-binding-like beta-propeller repeat protein [Verrucomicrobiae bacterium]|nr:PQQ-binding-like beta-propeller repeat protein [Verrucomicrobiae bacterium]
MTEAVLAAPVQVKRGDTLRLRFPVACVVAFWAAFIVIAFTEKLYFYSFLSQVASTFLFVVLFFGWWFFNRGLTWKQKLGGFAIIVTGAFLVAKFLDRSVNPFVLGRLGIPIVATVIVLWLKRARRNRAPFVGLTFFALVYATWACFLLVRSEGADSALKQSYFPRWTPSTEERFLAVKPSPSPTKVADAVELSPTKNQWTEFRGANRDGAVFGSTISTNWSAPPALLWKRPVGPAWSSISIVGQRLFTQEQRGASEAVVCYDAQNGEELWSHEDSARFEESLAGTGPRATPTFHEGKLFTLGGAGVLNCLDALTGKPVWQKNITEHSGARTPMWGFSSSPLIVGGKVIIYAGLGSGVVAYTVDKGEVVWSTPAGHTSYSSPQLAIIDGVSQCLMLHDGGLTGFDLSTGKKIWETGFSFPDGPRSNQAHKVGGNDLIVGGANNSMNAASISSFKVTRSGDSWTVATNWISKDMKPEFPDIVVHNNHAYGFDVALFSCINLADGKRTWKEGRYGRGQVILLADQNALLVASETGDLVLLAADSTTHRELGRFKALEGKTWAGPVVDGDRIYHRNAQEMACYTFNTSPPKTVAAFQ